MNDTPEESAEEHICWNCIGEGYLKDIVRRDGHVAECSYCSGKAESITLEDLAGRVEAAFDAHFTRTSSEPDGYQRAAMNDPESPYTWYREGDPATDAIQYAADLPITAAKDVQSILAGRHFDFDSAAMGEETPFGDEVHYEEIMPGDEEWREQWALFEKAIKSEARFFSRSAAAKLGALFDDIDMMRTRSGGGLLVAAGPGTGITHLFRARVFQSDDKLAKALERPDRELAAPPSASAASGRMNAKGISVFYGATSSEVAIDEVRPPVGSQVAAARFEIVRPLQLLDLNALAEIHVKGSIFDPAYASELGRMMFLRSLRDRIARPVMPDDQDTEYLPTQAIADYLATEGKVPLDGILYPSVQAGDGGLNVVLFHKASRCDELALPTGTTISARTYSDTSEGPERDYYVIEEVPPDDPDPSEDQNPFSGRFEPIDWDEMRSADFREATLRILPEEIDVHVVKGVKFTTSTYRVGRHRWSANRA